MSRQSPVRVLPWLVGLLVAITVCLVAFPAAASARSKNHSTSSGSKQAAASTTSAHAAGAPKPESPARANATSAAASSGSGPGLLALLDALLGNTVPTLVDKTVPTAVTHLLDRLGLSEGSSVRPPTRPVHPPSTPSDAARVEPTAAPQRVIPPVSPPASAPASGLRLNTAPLNGPSDLTPAPTAPPKSSPASSPRPLAVYPSSLSAVPDGTVVLIGVLLAFMVGVLAVVLSAGFRGRRAR